MEVERLGGVLREVGNFSMSDFDNRLIFQKTVYFLQEFGINMGYSFNWYIAGAYSPELAGDGFKLQVVYKKALKVGFVNPDDKENFKSFLGFMEKIKNNSRELELLASVHFLEKNKIEKKKILEIVKNKKNHFEDNEINEAYDILKKGGLLI